MAQTSTPLPKTQAKTTLQAVPASSSSRKHHAEMDQDKDMEFACDANPPTLVPAGKHDVVFTRAEKKVMWGTEKIFLWFQIASPGDFLGATLWMACNGPKKGTVGISSKFYGAWCLAAGKRPDRFDRMSTRIFRGKVFEAQVRVVTHDTKGRPLADALQYSIIDHLLSC